MIVSSADLQTLRQEHKKLKIGYVVGSFDLFHGGHLDYLEWAWDHCDILFVCVRSDARIKAVKGTDRPIFPQVDRARIVNSFKGTAFTHIAEGYVDAAKPSIKVAELLRPDLVILGNDWGNEAPLWREAMDDTLTNIVVCPMPWRESTTRIVNRIRFGR